MNYEKPSKKAIGCMYVASAILYIILITIIILALNLFIPNHFILFRNILMGIIGLLILEWMISPPIRFHRYRYLINEEGIDVKEGYIWTKRTIVPIERLHKIAVSQGPVDRLFSLSKVIVTTAGGDVVIRFLTEKETDFITSTLKNRINDIVIQGKVHEGSEEE